MVMRYSLMVVLFLQVVMLQATLLEKMNERCNVYKSCRFSEPLEANTWGLELYGGIEPIVWKDRGNFGVALILGEGVPFTKPFISALKLPCFSSLYKLPWTIGGQIGYSVDAHNRIYFETNYVKALEKTNDIFTVDQIIMGETVAFGSGAYKLIDCFLGLEHYFDRWYDTFSLFLGAKFGLAHHKNVSFNFIANIPNQGTFTVPKLLSFYERNTSVAGGFNMGLDVFLGKIFSFTMRVGVVGNGGFTFTNNDISGIISNNPVTNILLEGIFNEIRFPITFGIQASY